MTETVLTPDQAFGEVVHLRLRRRGIHQQMLGAYMGITQAAVSNKIRGTRPWSLADMTKAADFFGEELSGLVGEAERARRDSNPKPSDWSFSQVRACPFCDLPLDGHDWTCSSADNDAQVVDLAAYRSRVAA